MSYLYDVWDDFISLLFPRLCYACGNHLLRNENLICTECYIRIPRTAYHLQEDNPVARLFWGRCRIERAAAFSFYNKDSRIRKLIHNLKYRGVREIGSELGRIYGVSLKDTAFLEGINLIIPVPLHPSKERIRGFNQSSIIATGFSDVTGIPVNGSILVRQGFSESQTRRSRYERWMNVEGIFGVSMPEMAEGKHVLLIDDVITTGSTLEACANELLKCRDTKVSVAALAVAVV
ncbi:MAG: ComF family protein [Bacteroidales bacterium]|jgi:ComF family protein|nr:ComF family protein [Bacteroidales bacterium]